MILASFESHKRENPSCPVLIFFSLVLEAQLNSLSGKWWKRQNWLLSGQWANTKFKQLFTAIGVPLRGRKTRGASFIRLNVLEVSLSPDIKQQHLRNRRHSDNCNGGSCCTLINICNALWLTLIEDVNDPFLEAYANVSKCYRHRQLSGELNDVKDVTLSCLHIQKSALWIFICHNCNYRDAN